MRFAAFATMVFILAISGTAQAACDCQDVDKDGYPDNGSACTGSFAERESVWNPAPATRDLRIRFSWSQRLDTLPSRTAFISRTALVALLPVSFCSTEPRMR